MQNHSPLVSVIVPSYNHERFIEQCIDSIFAQTFKDFELIVIDDGSSDSSRDILRELQRKYNFTLVLQENIGVSRTLNRGVREYAQGEYVSFCASDDYWLPQKLEKQVLFMAQHPNIPMCYCKTYYVDEKNNIDFQSSETTSKAYKGGNIFADILLQNFHLPVNYFFRKSIFEQTGYYREDILTEDFYMNLRISHKYEIGFIDDYLSCYRVSNRFTPKNMKTPNAHLKCINEYKDSKYYKDAITKWHFRNFIWFAANKKNKFNAFTGMVHSARYIFDADYIKSAIKLAFIWK